MKEKEFKTFPGQKKGIIQILIKPTNEEESVQLRFELEFDDANSINSQQQENY